VKPRVSATIRKPVRRPVARKPIVRRTIRKHVRPIDDDGATTPPWPHSPGLDIPTDPSFQDSVVNDTGGSGGLGDSGGSDGSNDQSAPQDGAGSEG
jgi:hypothetical protein